MFSVFAVIYIDLHMQKKIADNLASSKSVHTLLLVSPVQTT